MNTIKFLNLTAYNQTFRDEFHAALDEVLDNDSLINGKAVTKFESDCKLMTHAEHNIGVSNGMDALTLIIRAYKEVGKFKDGDEIIIAANTYIATALAVSLNNLVPVLVEPDEYHLIDVTKIRAAITDKTVAIMPVHLYGQMADMEEINRIAYAHNLIVIEDSAQSHFATRGKYYSGSAGNASGCSLYPGKNLGALGDGGIISTNDTDLATLIRAMKNYGSHVKYVNDIKGFNNRLDTLQAAFLSVKIQTNNMHNFLERKHEIAHDYLTKIDNPWIELPKVAPDSYHVWHLFVIKTEYRDELAKYLADNGIETLVHYPIPLYNQKAYAGEFDASKYEATTKLANQVLSLPICPMLTQDEVDTIITVINKFKG